MDLQSKSKKELISFCKKNSISGYSNNGKKAIIDLIKANTETNSKQENEIIEKKKEDVPVAIVEKKDVGDLYKSNLKLLQTIFDTCLLGQLNREYTYKENNDQNIYDFIDAYRNTIKRQFNIDNDYNANSEDLKYFKETFENTLLKNDFLNIFKLSEMKKFILEII